MTTYNKLVRDNIPEIIQASGGTPKIRVLNGQEYADALVDKLDEEVDEFKAARSLEELADVQEVILALADVLGGRKELERVRAEKAARRGAFARQIFLEEA